MRFPGLVGFSLLLSGIAPAEAVNLNVLPGLDKLSHQSLFDNVNFLLEDQQAEIGPFDFSPGTAELLPGNDARARDLVQTVNEYAGMLKEAFPKLHVSAEGHTDADGTPQQRRTLSTARAKAVCGALRSAGLKLRCVATGVGATLPVVFPEASEADKQANRRVIVQLAK